jgi:hypothetical protein
VPPIRLVLLDENGNQLYQWTEKLKVDRLKPKQEEQLVARLSSPPPNSRELVIEFEQDVPNEPIVGQQ